MEDIPISALYVALAVQVILSAFFSSSETGMMAINRYRLKHLVKQGNRSAILTQRLLDRPDRLMGVILLGNNIVNFSAATVGALIGMRLLGDLGVALSPFVVVFIFLILAEVVPKTFAAIHPEKIAFPAAYVLTFLLWLLSPFVWVINRISNTMLNVIGVKPEEVEDAPLTQEELRTVVREAGSMIPSRHQKMLLSILELENETVDDIMVPRNEVSGINIEDSEDEIIAQLNNARHTRLAVFEGNLDGIVGVIHVRKLPRILNDIDNFSIDEFKAQLVEPYFVPEGTPLNTQIMNFQREKRRQGFVVDEYGMVLGIITLEDILEEIVGEFTTDIQVFNQDIQENEDGSYIIDASVNIRDLNKQLQWNLPTDGPKTLNGLLLEQLEQIPDAGTSLKLDNLMVEITQTTDSAIKTTKVILID